MAARPPYAPPEGDAPLDEIELATVRMWVAILAREIREENAAAAAKDKEMRAPRLMPDTAPAERQEVDASHGYPTGTSATRSAIR